jgi:hypothetical protein
MEPGCIIQLAQTIYRIAYKKFRKVKPRRLFLRFYKWKNFKDPIKKQWRCNSFLKKTVQLICFCKPEYFHRPSSRCINIFAFCSYQSDHFYVWQEMIVVFTTKTFFI